MTLDQLRDELLNRYEVLTPSRAAQDMYIKQAADAGDQDAIRYIAEEKRSHERH